MSDAFSVSMFQSKIYKPADVQCEKTKSAATSSSDKNVGPARLRSRSPTRNTYSTYHERYITLDKKCLFSNRDVLLFKSEFLSCNDSNWSFFLKYILVK
jgi:hypothetical protein